MCKCVLISKLEDAIKKEGDFSSDDPIASYVEFVLAVPSMRPRRIERAKDFSCPDENKQGLLRLEEAILKGWNLLPWMSKKYSKEKFFGEDHLMHLFSVSHFHLGNEYEKNNRIKRTKNLLYASVADDVVYELAVRGHGEWSSQEWQDKLVANWPEAFSRYMLPPQYTALTREPITDAQLLRLTAAGINTVVRTSSGLSMPIGGGVTSAKTSARAQVIADGIRYFCDDIETEYLKRHGSSHDELNLVELLVDGESLSFIFSDTEHVQYLIPRDV